MAIPYEQSQYSALETQYEHWVKLIRRGQKDADKMQEPLLQVSGSTLKGQEPRAPGLQEGHPWHCSEAQGRKGDSQVL